MLDELDPDTVTADQLPVLIKASAAAAAAACGWCANCRASARSRRPAARRSRRSAIPTVFCERYRHRPPRRGGARRRARHRVGVGERECSIQRHQKIIEEAPSPLVERTPGMRAKLFDAARLAATAIGYTGAGTVEFMADDNGDFFFLEMNTGCRSSIRSPRPPPASTSSSCNCMSPTAAGSIPNRRRRAATHRGPLYAEDPAKGWQPQAGTVHRFDAAATGALDSGMVDGIVAAVSVFYDPMLAKIISYAPTRRQAAGTRRRAGPHPHPRRAHQPRPAGQRAAASGLPRRRHRHRVLRHPRPGRTGRAAGRHRAVALSAWPPRWPMPPGIAQGATVFAPRRAAGATCRVSRQELRRHRGRGARGPLPVHPHRRGRAATRRRAWFPPRRHMWCCRRRRGPAVRRRPLRRRRVRRLSARPGATRRAAAFPDPEPPSRTVRCWRRCRARCCASAPRSATPSPRASR